MTGQRQALIIGAVALGIGVAFVLLRGGTPAVATETESDDIDLELEPV
jgi:hypothetical protein